MVKCILNLKWNLDNVFDSPVQTSSDIFDDNEILKSVLETSLEKLENPEYLGEIKNMETIEDGPQTLENEIVSESTDEIIETESLEEFYACPVKCLVQILLKYCSKSLL